MTSFVDDHVDEPVGVGGGGTLICNFLCAFAVSFSRSPFPNTHHTVVHTNIFVIYIVMANEYCHSQEEWKDEYNTIIISILELAYYWDI